MRPMAYSASGASLLLGKRRERSRKSLSAVASSSAFQRQCAAWPSARALYAPVSLVARARQSASAASWRSEEHTSELQSLTNLVCRLLLEKKKTRKPTTRKRNRHREPT